jgi:hypothetical protein
MLFQSETVGLWMTIQGIQWKPLVSLATVMTIATGALVYHIRLRNARAR